MHKSQKSAWIATSILLLAGLAACGNSNESGATGKVAESSTAQAGQVADKIQLTADAQGGAKNVVSNADVSSVDTGHAAPQIVQQAALESGAMSKADDMKVEPFRDAQSLKSLPAGEKLEIVSRQGGWYKVNVGKATGWVHMLSVRKGDAKKGADTATGLLALSSGRAGTGNVVATTGVRGLNEEELKAAKFDEAELLRAEANASSKADAAQFAKQGELVARPFNYLPAK